MLESFLKLLDSYPNWAKAVVVGAIVVAVVVLVFAKKVDPPKPPPVKADEQIYLRISRIELFPKEDSAEIKLIADVNGTLYTFPSEGGAEWMRVGPDMNKKIFPMPKSERYVVGLRLVFKDGRSASGEAIDILRAANAAASDVPAVPFAGTFKLRPITAGVSSQAVLGQVSFELNSKGFWGQ